MPQLKYINAEIAGNELPSESLSRVYSIEAILEAIQRFVDFDTEQGTLRRDDQVHRYYMNVVRLCLQADMATSVETFNNVNIPMGEQDPSDTRLQDRLMDSTEPEVTDGILPDEYPELRNAEQSQEGSQPADSDILQSLVHLQSPVPSSNIEFAKAASTSAPEFDTLNEAPHNTIHTPYLVSEDERNRSHERHLLNSQLPEASFDLAHTSSQDLVDDLWDFGFDLDMETPDAVGPEGL